MDMLSKVHLFPVRHHSPRASVVLERWLRELRPSVVLVEGPSDATSLMDLMVDRETAPPVAILGYVTEGEPRSALWPFAAYSPELVAIRWAKAHGVRVEFMDLSTGQSLAADRTWKANVPPDSAPAPSADDEDDGAEGPGEGEGQAAAPDGALEERMAQARGYRSFEEFWEACFEAPRYEPAGFRAALMAYAEVVRHAPTLRAGYHRARDAVMVRHMERVVASGVEASQVAVVCGAAHAAAFAAGDVDLTLAARFERTVATAVTLIPYSYPRLAEQTGYGAGNRAPMYYQRAFAAGGDYRRATLEVLVEFCEHLRLRGFMASLSDTIEAFRLACMLADIRGKAEPGLDEVREATVATMCRGDATHVDGFLWPAVIGRAVGRVASRVGKNSLQQEFWRELDTRRLPSTDSPETFTLHLTNAQEVGSSVFLHRLRVADIPYASFLGTHAGRSAMTGGAAPETAGGVHALARAREAWEAQWTPATDVGLVERIVLGDTLELVCERTLADQLRASTSTGGAAHVLMEAVVTSCPNAMGAALTACDRHASTDDDLPSLATACRALSGLVSYGTSRQLAALGDDVIVPLCRKTFDRAVLRVERACSGNADAVAPVKPALRTLHELAVSQKVVDGSSWFSAARTLVHSYVVNPTCSGMACGLLYLAQQLTDDDVTQLVSQRLSNTLEAQAASAFLAGFLEVNALVLVKSRPVVAALDGFLCGIPRDRFKDALPMLRSAFSPLGATERRYLLENLLSVRRIGEKARAAAAIVTEKDKEKLKAMGDDMKKAMDDLDDLL